MAPAVALAVVAALAAVVVPAGAADRTADGLPRADWSGAPFADQLVVGGLPQALGADFLPDGRLLVLGKEGHVALVDPIGGTASTVLTVPSLSTTGERGALDVLTSPTFATDRHFYVYYSGADFKMRVDRFTLGTPAETAASQTNIWTSPTGKTVHENFDGSHLGGSMDFGPDGNLYVTIGETFTASFAQDLTNPWGKVLRLRPDGSIPPDNPFADGPGPNADEIWAYGLRNPFRAGFDRATGALWVGDVGGNRHDTAYEEINVIQRGGDYGWPDCEGPLTQPKNGVDCPPGTVGPVVYYAHDPSLGTGFNASTTGGEVYRGTAYPASLRGAYLYGDYGQHEIRFATLSSPTTAETDGVLVDVGERQPTWVGVGPDGLLYYVHFSFSGSTSQLRRLVWTGSLSPPPVIHSASAAPTSGPAPLAVQFGATASDPDGTPVGYRWSFGDGGTAVGPNPVHTYTASGRYEAQLEVQSGGDTVRSEPVVVNVGSPPTATITSPPDGTTFVAGETVVVQGAGGDDEPLPAGALRWEVVFVHDQHTHPSQHDVPGDSVTLSIPTSGHGWEGDTGYRVTLTVTDADGLSASTSILLRPRKVPVALESNLGLTSVTVDGIAQPLPYDLRSLQGFRHDVQAPAAVCRGGHEWRFAGWSGGRPAAFTLTVPDEPTTMRADYADAGPAAHCTRSGYWLVDEAGAVYAFGDAAYVGGTNASPEPATVDLEPTPTGNGYWILDVTGTVHRFGDAGLGGPAGAMASGESAAAISSTPSGLGYWVFTSRGRVLPVGDAVHHGDMAGVPLNGPVLDAVATPGGGGYFMVGSDGGVFAFGDAGFAGSTGGMRLNAPVQSLVPDPDGTGYWLVAADGGVFAFDAAFRGSVPGVLPPGTGLNRPVRGMEPYGDGYLMVAEDGGTFVFSDLPFTGSLGATPPAHPVVAIAAA